MAQLDATTLITFNPPSVRVDETLRNAFESFCQWQVTEIPVVDREQRLLGVLQLGSTLERLEGATDSLNDPISQVPLAQPDPYQLHRFPRIALQQLLAEGYRLLPVVEADRLIGTLGRADFLREFAVSGARLTRESVLEHALRAGDGVEASATIEEAFEYMNAERIDYVPIMQSGCPLAVATLSELQACLQLARAHELISGEQQNSQTIVRLVRTSAPLQPGQSMAEAAIALVENNAMALMVVNKAKRMMGVITESLVLGKFLRG